MQIDTRRARTDRRRLLKAAVLPGSSLFLSGVLGRSAAARQAGSTAEGAAEVGSAAAPAWLLEVFAIEDPYTGTVQQPPAPEPGTRYIAAEIAIDNGADQPLNFNPVEVRLRDSDGVEYRGGTALGTEPLISARNLNGGERSRGWIWFTVAQDAEIEALVYVGPPPQFRVDLSARSSD